MRHGPKGKNFDAKTGKELEGLEYEPIFNNSNLSYKIYCDNYVKDDTGTGLVHLAPLFAHLTPSCYVQ